MEQVKVDIKMSRNTLLPRYETTGAAGMDVRYWLDPMINTKRGEEAIAVHPNTTERIGTGLRVAVPEGYEIQVRSRSGLAFRGITVANSPGTIDSDYRGEIGVMLHNSTDEIFYVNPGDRVAQLVLAPVVQAWWNCVSVLDETDRGEGALGSTGIE